MAKQTDKEQGSTKIWKDTLRDAKLAAVLSDRTMVQLFDDLVTQELARLKQLEKEKEQAAK